MARGENIFKRKDGRWEARYVKGHDLSGKIRYGYCYGKTYREAKEKVTKCKANMALGIPIPGRNQKHSFGAYCDEWLLLNKLRLKESTYVKYHTAVTRHIQPKLGACRISQLSTELIRQFTEELIVHENLSPKTVKDILVVLRSILNYAAKQNPGVVPNIEIVYPKAEKSEMRVLTIEEQRRFMAYLLTDMDACKFGVLLALLTGLRIGEICALRWSEISTEQFTLQIKATMMRLQNVGQSVTTKTRIVVGVPKSNASVRVIPLREDLAGLCRKMDPHNSNAYVLTGSEKLMEPRVLQYRLARYTKDCNLEHVHFHTLRHTFATRCVEAGFEIKSLSEILGHANTPITLERYVHPSMELKRSNMEKLAVMSL